MDSRKKFNSIVEYRARASWERVFDISSDYAQLLSEACDSEHRYKRLAWVLNRADGAVDADELHRLEVLAFDVAWRHFHWVVMPSVEDICKAWRSLSLA